MFIEESFPIYLTLFFFNTYVVKTCLTFLFYCVKDSVKEMHC